MALQASNRIVLVISSRLACQHKQLAPALHTATSLTGSPGTQSSALLDCLSQLNSDVWAQVLLPKLVEQGSAAAVSLTCSQLRDLCFNSIDRITMDLPDLVLGAQFSYLESWMQGAPLHFPNCTAVSLKLGTEESYHTMPYILTALARLRQLKGMSITLPDDMQPLLTCTMLYSMRMQLPGLQSLTVAANDPLSWMRALGVHKELGKATQLTQLCLDINNTKDAFEAEKTWYGVVRQLSGLKQLQHLAIWAKDWDFTYCDHRYNWYGGWPELPYQLLSSLTALTRLETNICDVSSLAAVSSCVNLQHLLACLESGNMEVETDNHELEPEHWEHLAPLTRLTELWLMNVGFISAIPEACDALSKLSRLQVVAAAHWSSKFLPALAACVRLTEICGDWTGGECPGVAMPQVLVLSGAHGAQLEYFPNVSHYRVDVCVDGLPALPSFCMLSPLYLQSMCMHCTGLKELDLTAIDSSLSRAVVGPHVELSACSAGMHAAAIRSLTSLHQLTCLKFTPGDNLQLLSLVQACCVLEGHSLHVNQGLEPTGFFDMSAGAWLQLGQLRQLRKLSVEIGCQQICDHLGKEALAFLSAVSRCGSVVLKLLGSSLPYEAALVALREAGMPVPHVDLKAL